MKGQSCLEVYFYNVVKNDRVLSQFRTEHILLILRNDLQIDLGAPESLYSKVCVETFMYYLESWSKWNQLNTNDSELLFNELKFYLKTKFKELKEKVYFFRSKNISKNIVELLDTKLKLLNVIKPGSLSLRIDLPEKMLQGSDLFFQQLSNSDDLLLKFNKTTPSIVKFPMEYFLNYPFIEVDFHIPEYIHFKRSVTFISEQFLMDLNIKPTMKKPFILAIDNSTYNTSSRVYTFSLLSLLFKELSIFAKCNKKVSKAQREAVLEAVNQFMLDISEANLCGKTVCEDVKVSYNVGKSTYFVDSFINCKDMPWILSDLRMMSRKVLTPVVQYSLISCSILGHYVNAKGINYFEFQQSSKISHLELFAKHIDSCLKYRCTLCDLYDTPENLILHMKAKHHLNDIMQCSNCFKYSLLSDLFKNRWKHNCVDSI